MTDYKNGKGHEDRQSDSGKYELVNLNSISIDGGLKPSGKFVDHTTDTLLENDLVMVLSDVGHGDLLGRVALIPGDGRFVLNQRVALLRPNGTVEPQFLFSYINAHQRYFKSQGAGMSQLNISKGSVENFVLCVPKKEEQVKIGTLFKNLDNLITLHQRKGEYLYIDQFWNYNKFTSTWEQRKLGELSESTYGGGTPRTSNDTYWNGEIPWIQSSDLTEHQISNVQPRKYISKSGLSNSATKLVPENSIAIVE